MSLKNFEILCKLGEGVYSTVYKVVRHEDKKTYALKRVKILSLSQREKQNALNEIRILASMHSPNVISYKQAFIDEPSKSLWQMWVKCSIVMEFANNGDLGNLIEEKKKKGIVFEEKQIWDIFIQIVKGLSQLHQMNICHRDIKSANIFLQQEKYGYEEGQGATQLAKLGDMNVSKVSEQGLCMTQTGTPYYASPEVWKDRPYDSKSDIWSLGCVLYEMLALKPPFQAEDMEGLYKKVTKGIYPKIPSKYSPEINTIIRNLLQTNPEARPSCQKILKMAETFKKTEKQNQFRHSQKQRTQLIHEIKPTSTLHELTQVLPKPNYETNGKHKRQKSQNNPKLDMAESESLPCFEKQRQMRSGKIALSDRMMLRDKKQANLIMECVRKKGDSNIKDEIKKNKDKDKNNDKNKNKKYTEMTNHKKSRGNIIVTVTEKEIKLPKVENRYSQAKDHYNMKSLKNHYKAFD